MSDAIGIKTADWGRKLTTCRRSTTGGAIFPGERHRTPACCNRVRAKRLER